MTCSRRLQLPLLFKKSIKNSSQRHTAALTNVIHHVELQTYYHFSLRVFITQVITVLALFNILLHLREEDKMSCSFVRTVSIFFPLLCNIEFSLTQPVGHYSQPTSRA